MITQKEYRAALESLARKVGASTEMVEAQIRNSVKKSHFNSLDFFVGKSVITLKKTRRGDRGARRAAKAAHAKKRIEEVMK